MPMLFLNLPVKDLETSKRFYGALGFSFNPDFSDESAACMVVDDNIFVMLLQHERFKDFINGEIGDATKATDHLIALSADSRAGVDDLVAKALAAGGTSWKPVQDLGFMYSHSFQDPDGHVWEPAYMDMEQQ